LRRKKIVSKLFSPTGKTVSLVALASLMNSVIALVSGLLVASWLLPERLGLFNAFSIFTSYIILAQVGIPSGLSRQLAFYFGQQKENLAKSLASTARLFSVILSGGSLIICGLVSIYFFIIGNNDFAAGAIVIGITTAQTFYVTKYLKVLYRSNNHFTKLAHITFINSAVNLVSILLVYKFLFYGLCLRAILLALVDWYLSEKWKPLDVPLQWKKSNFKELLKRGLPMFSVSSIYGLWPTFQRTIVLSFLGTQGLGLFSLAIVVQNLLNTVNATINTVSFPKMSHALGEGKNIKEILKIPLNLSFFAFGIYTLILIVGWPLLPVVVKYALPNYVLGIEAAQWMLLVALVSSFSVFSNIYMVIKTNHHRLISYCFGILVWSVFLLIEGIGEMSDLVVFSKALLAGSIAITLIDGLFLTYYIRSNKTWL
jgi:O-antigen/teichoic acid export membrane protein